MFDSFIRVSRSCKWIKNGSIVLLTAATITLTVLLIVLTRNKANGERLTISFYLLIYIYIYICIYEMYIDQSTSSYNGNSTNATSTTSTAVAITSTGINSSGSSSSGSLNYTTGTTTATPRGEFNVYEKKTTILRSMDVDVYVDEHETRTHTSR